MSQAAAPTLDGYVTHDGVHVVVWCKHCRRLHSHGHGGPDKPLGNGDGHRAAHCADPKKWSISFGYRYGGYRICEVGWFAFEADEQVYADLMRSGVDWQDAPQLPHLWQVREPPRVPSVGDTAEQR